MVEEESIACCGNGHLHIRPDREIVRRGTQFAEFVMGWSRDGDGPRGRDV